ncbi:MAG: NAD-binding protein [Promethearchaeota archaeon]
MNIGTKLIGLHLSLKKYMVQFFILFLFWLMGFIFFLITEPNQGIWHLILLSWTIRTPINGADFANFYSSIFPILLELVVFGFIMIELLEKYNPVITSKILAGTKTNHTVVIGYGHLSERIIEYCKKNKKPFCLIEDNQELVEDLINAGSPVVVGDPTDNPNLELVNIKHAREVFICINDVRIAIICTEKIRAQNPDCKIYVRAFGDHVQEYLAQDPLNAYSFSTSKWAMTGIHKWIEDKTGKSIVIGRDYLTHRIAYEISLQPGRDVYLFDDENDGIPFPENAQMHIIQEFACYLSDLSPHVNLNEVTQIFICWIRDSEFDEALYLTSKFHELYPNIEVYVRIYDDEILELVKKFNAKTFSSSKNAFQMLQKDVSTDSAISPHIAKK